LYGGIFKAERAGKETSIFEIQAEVGFKRSDIGVSLVLATLDEQGKSELKRYLFLDGSRTNLAYAMPLDVVIEQNVSDSPLNMYRPSGYNPLKKI
jgi:hypothetical protein